MSPITYCPHSISEHGILCPITAVNGEEVIKSNGHLTDLDEMCIRDRDNPYSAQPMNLRYTFDEFFKAMPVEEYEIPITE